MVAIWYGIWFLYGFYVVAMWWLCGLDLSQGNVGPLSVTHVGTWNDEECGDWECDTASDGIGQDGATSQDRASPVPVSSFSPLCFK